MQIRLTPGHSRTAPQTAAASTAPNGRRPSTGTRYRSAAPSRRPGKGPPVTGWVPAPAGFHRPQLAPLCIPVDRQIVGGHFESGASGPRDGKSSCVRTCLWPSPGAWTPPSRCRRQQLSSAGHGGVSHQHLQTALHRRTFRWAASAAVTWFPGRRVHVGALFTRPSSSRTPATIPAAECSTAGTPWTSDLDGPDVAHCHQSRPDQIDPLVLFAAMGPPLRCSCIPTAHLNCILPCSDFRAGPPFRQQRTDLQAALHYWAAPVACACTAPGSSPPDDDPSPRLGWAAASRAQAARQTTRSLVTLRRIGRNTATDSGSTRPH